MLLIAVPRLSVKQKISIMFNLCFKMHTIIYFQNVRILIINLLLILKEKIINLLVILKEKKITETNILIFLFEK